MKFGYFCQVSDETTMSLLGELDMLHLRHALLFCVPVAHSHYTGFLAEVWALM